MRLPFFRAKDSAAQPAQPRRGGGAGLPGMPDEGPVQAARTQARRRLVGALVLLAAGVIGFPVLFETQPRPLPVDTPMLVAEGVTPRGASAARSRPPPELPPDAGNETGTAPPAPVASTSAPAASMPRAALPAAAPGSAAASGPASVPVLRPGVPPRVPPAASAATPPVTPPVAQAAAAVPKPAPALASPKLDATATDAPKVAKAPSAPDAAAGRFVVQVGAYNDIERLKAARQKLDKLGYKSYTQDVETPTGKRTRVRVGPYASRQEAEAVAGKVKAGGMQANILSL